ncbi:MAG: SAF domain-containing protein [Actinobacteria bacterium]|nr:SAF domain-containing protein [Actinomycetota bacterium]
MLNLNSHLQQLEDMHCPIKVAVNGATWMGSGLIAQSTLMRGMEVVLLADVQVERARNALISCGFADSDITVAEEVDEAFEAVAGGKRVVTASYTMAAQVQNIDIVADLTASPSIGAETATSCIQHGKDVVMVNIEVDVTIGSILRQMADEAGVLYTVSSGDEPGALKELYDFANGLGYEVIAMGKGKNNPLDREANPKSMAQAAQKVNKDPGQIASFVDGTKTMFEMACVANGTGLVPAVPGMYGPAAKLADLARVFALKENGGLLDFPGVVDYSIGSDVAGGVFVVIRVDNPRVSEDLEYLKVGKGPYFCFFRPYHLWFLEAPLSIARAYLRKEPTLVPLPNPVAEVVAVAKKDLNPGEILDGFGGFSCYGLLLKALEARGLNALPMGLAEGAVVKDKITKGQIIYYDMIELDKSSLLVQLRHKQEATF